MDELIRRGDAVAVFGDVHPLDYNAQSYLSQIKKLPARSPQIEIAADIYDEVVGHHCEFKCSRCNKEIYEIFCHEDFCFCPFCGAALITDKEG